MVSPIPLPLATSDPRAICYYRRSLVDSSSPPIEVVYPLILESLDRLVPQVAN